MLQFATTEILTDAKLALLENILNLLTLSWQRPLSYRNQSIDLLWKSMDWFLYDNGLRHERVNLYSKHIPSDASFSRDAAIKENFLVSQSLLFIRFHAILTERKNIFFTTSYIAIVFIA